MHKTIIDIMQKKGNQKISVVTSYDYTMATLCDQVDILLVGDSAGMVMLGYENTCPVTMDEMVMFTKAVANGRQNALIVADLPNKSYENEADAVSNSKRLFDAGADAVKLEGRLPDIIKAITKAGIPVMGHLGLLPQTAKRYTVQGKTKKGTQVLLEDAKALQEAGCFSIVFEMVTADTMYAITEAVSVPTIGIGCGKYCDGQVLVIHDMLGLFEKFQPKFVKRYLSLSEQIKKAISQYVKDVEDITFPADEHSFYGYQREQPPVQELLPFGGNFGGGIESSYNLCCIFFFIYCRSSWYPTSTSSSRVTLQNEARFYRKERHLVGLVEETVGKKLPEELKRRFMELERKDWFEGQGSCWAMGPGYIRCPDCIVKEVKHKTRRASWVANFLKEQK